jgi:hypothetical protein
LFAAEGMIVTESEMTLSPALRSASSMAVTFRLTTPAAAEPNVVEAGSSKDTSYFIISRKT